VIAIRSNYENLHLSLEVGLGWPVYSFEQSAIISNSPIEEQDSVALEY